MFRVGSIIREC